MEVEPVRGELFFAFMESSNLLEHLMSAQLRRDGGISYLQFVILVRLSSAPEGRTRLSDLANSAVHSRSGLTYQARVMDDAGLITRRPSTEDERATDVFITDAGREVLDRVWPGHVAVVTDGLYSTLSTDESVVFSERLLRIREHLRLRFDAESPRRIQRPS